MGRQKPNQRSLTRAPIKRIMCMCQLSTIEQRMDVAGHRIGRHDEGCIERMHITAGDRAGGMAEKRRDGDLGETKVVRQAGEAVAQYMSGDVRQLRPGEDLFPMPREAAEPKPLRPRFA